MQLLLVVHTRQRWLAAHVHGISWPGALTTRCRAVQGYMHAGGVLDPGVIANITAKAVRTEFGSKVSGATALVRAVGLASPVRVANLFSSPGCLQWQRRPGRLRGRQRRAGRAGP